MGARGRSLFKRLAMMGCSCVCRLLPPVQHAAHVPMVQQPSVCAPAPALYPHQIAYQQQQLSQALRPPQQLQMPQQARPIQQQHIPQQLAQAPYQATNAGQARQLAAAAACRLLRQPK